MMKPRVLPLLSVLLMGASTAVAAPAAPARGKAPTSPPQRSGKPWKGFLDRMEKELNLSPLQKRRIDGIFEATSGEREAIMADTSLTPQQKMAKLKAWNDKSKRKVRSILTPAQRTKFDAIVKKMNRPVGGPRRSASQFDLGLTAAQQEKMGKTMRELRPRYDAVIKNKSLKDPQKRAKFQELNAIMEKRINAILTPEQRKKRAAAMKELMEEGRKRNQDMRGKGQIR